MLDIVFNKRVANSFVNEINSKIISMYNNDTFWYLSNMNISNIHLFLIYLHLLVANFICKYANFYGRIYTIQTYILNQRYSYIWKFSA